MGSFMANVANWELLANEASGSRGENLAPGLDERNTRASERAGELLRN